MTPYHRLILFAAAAAMAAGCVPTQRAVRGPGARGTEAWSWRMGATEGRWSSDRSQSAARTALDRNVAPARDAGGPEPAAAAEDEVEMTLEPDPVGPAKKPKAVAVAPAPRPRAERRAPASARPIRASDSDEEFLNKILDDNADAEDGEITMAAVELGPKGKKERAAAKKKLAAPVIDPAVDLAADLAPVKPAKKKKLTRAEKRKARLLAKAEKKKAKEIAAREARLRGKRARIDEEEQKRASHARKAKRNKRKGKFFKNGEGFIEEDGASDEEEEDEQEVAASSDDEDDEDEDAEDEAEDEDEEEEDDAPPPRKKSKQMVASSKSPAKAAAKGKVVKVKTDWSGQAIDDEDPLKAKKK